MNKFTTADEGKAAIFIDRDGTTRSVHIREVGTQGVIVSWPTGPRAVAFATLEAKEWHNLSLFPAGAMFATI